MSLHRHLLNEILSPRSLDESEQIGIDKGDMVKASDFADFLVDVRTSQKAVQSGRILRYRAMMVVGNFQVHPVPLSELTASMSEGYCWIWIRQVIDHSRSY